MELTMYRPFRAMRPTRHSLSHFFGNRLFDIMNEEGSSEFERFYPSIDISETDKDIKLKAELPGIDKGDVKLEVKDGLLTIKGEKKFEHEDKRKDFRRIERSYGSFYRSFQIPEEIKEDDIKGEYTNGVLELCLPMKEPEKRKAKKIIIQ